MNQLLIQFDRELNIFLPKQHREHLFTHQFKGNPSIKDLIESLGIPHTEIAALRVNEKYVGFNYQVQNKDRIMVYSHQTTRSLGIKSNPIGNNFITPRFILDVHLGKLASYLRLLGFDCLYNNSHADEALAKIAQKENRILLTRDRGLLKRKIVEFGYLIRSTDPKKQISEVLERYQLFNQVEPFSRCARCNGKLKPISKEAVVYLLKPNTIQYYDSFSICEDCNRVYWKGSHFEKLKAYLEQFRLPPGRPKMD